MKQYLIVLGLIVIILFYVYGYLYAWVSVYHVHELGLWIFVRHRVGARNRAQDFWKNSKHCQFLKALWRLSSVYFSWIAEVWVIFHVLSNFLYTIKFQLHYFEWKYSVSRHSWLSTTDLSLSLALVKDHLIIYMRIDFWSVYCIPLIYC